MSGLERNNKAHIGGPLAARRPRRGSITLTGAGRKKRKEVRLMVWGERLEKMKKCRCEAPLPGTAPLYATISCATCGKEYYYTLKYGWLPRVDNSFEEEFKNAAPWKQNNYRDIIKCGKLDETKLTNSDKGHLLWLAASDNDTIASFLSILRKAQPVDAGADRRPLD